MPGIALTPEQTELRDALVELLDRLLNWAQSSPDEIDAWMDELADKAFTLHQQLKVEGQEPRYPAAVLAKRGMGCGTKEFYRHMYAVENLLQFLAEGYAKK